MRRADSASLRCSRWHCVLRSPQKFIWGVLLRLALPTILLRGASAVGSILALGDAHTCAARSDGRVVCWGRNEAGQLGIGNTNYIGDGPNEMGTNLLPVNLGTGLNATALVAGLYHNCAVRSDSRVVCWGYNFYGQLGIGNTNNIGDGANEMGSNLMPVDLGSGVFAATLVAGEYHTCALRSDGKVVCWGYNGYGELGVGHRNSIGDGANEMGDSLVPVDLGSGQSAAALYSGQHHVCAVRSDGRVVCWGFNNLGQLGIGNVNYIGDGANEMGNNLVPVDIGSAGLSALFTGGWHNCALLSNGRVVCWGRNNYGQLGIGNTNNIGDGANEMGSNLVPVNLGTGLFAAALAEGGWHSCALLSDGRVVCWGYNTFGQLGIGNTNNIGDGANEMGSNLLPVNLSNGA